MFDTIECDYPLPLPEFQKDEFQTKDLDCCMMSFRIDKDGQLWERKSVTEWVEGDAAGKSFSDRLGHIKELSHEWVKCDVTDYVEFYTSKVERWVSFRAHIRNGIVQEIVIMEDQINGWLHIDHPEVK